MRINSVRNKGLRRCQSLVSTAVGAAVSLWTACSPKVIKFKPDAGSVLDEVKMADAANDIRREISLLQHAESLSLSPTDVAEVQRRLAVLDWKYYALFEKARARLIQAASAGAEPAGLSAAALAKVEAWLALARMEQAQGDFAAARRAAITALDHAKTESVRRNSGLAAARASVAEAVQLRLGGEIAVSDTLRMAFDWLNADLAAEAGSLEPSQLLLRAALILDHGDAALAAWRSYYHAAPGLPMPNAVSNGGKELERLLPGWLEHGEAIKDRIDLVKALADSRFFTEAALVALDPGTDPAVREDPRVREIIAYERFIRDIRSLAEEYYRKTALGNGDASRFVKVLTAICADIAPVLVGNSAAARFKKEFKTKCVALAPELVSIKPDARPSNRKLLEMLRERFGLVAALGVTAGYFDLHMGHIVVDETRVIEQYGARAKVRFVQLDNMTSNGFQSWAWESGAQHGGWAERGKSYQVRPGFADGPLWDWRSINGTERIQKQKEEMARESALDDERATRDPFGYLPGLALRLRHQGLIQIKERLARTGLADNDLRLAFLAAVESAVQESSIFAHEGRHVLQKQVAPGAGFYEFPAKLSQVAFAPEPRLALGDIFFANIGDATPHGRANRKIMEGLVSWMKKRADDIPKLAPDRPLLPQFDLLTDEQIRTAFRSMDPMAQGR